MAAPEHLEHMISILAFVPVRLMRLRGISPCQYCLEGTVCLSKPITIVKVY